MTCRYHELVCTIYICGDESEETAGLLRFRQTAIPRRVECRTGRSRGLSHSMRTTKGVVDTARRAKRHHGSLACGTTVCVVRKVTSASSNAFTTMLDTSCQRPAPERGDRVRAQLTTKTVASPTSRFDSPNRLLAKKSNAPVSSVASAARRGGKR